MSDEIDTGTMALPEAMKGLKHANTPEHWRMLYEASQRALRQALTENSANAERVKALEAALEKVEWLPVDGGSSFQHCPWCGGIEDEPPSGRLSCESEENYAEYVKDWEAKKAEYHLGHKNDCPRQAALKGGE
jgi:hypothetical protein